jgi:predicted GNAT family acetyltransferase
MELEVADHPEQERFEIRADGELAGFVDYRLHDGEIELLHAETLTHFRHRGFAGQLVQFSLDAGRARQLAVLPYCPFVRRWIADHPEYADLVPEDRRPYFGLLPSPAGAWGGSASQHR